jgi:hypothetical protein
LVVQSAQAATLLAGSFMGQVLVTTIFPPAPVLVDPSLPPAPPPPPSRGATGPSPPSPGCVPRQKIETDFIVWQEPSLTVAVIVIRPGFVQLNVEGN